MMDPETPPAPTNPGPLLPGLLSNNNNKSPSIGGSPMGHGGASPLNLHALGLAPPTTPPTPTTPDEGPTGVRYEVQMNGRENIYFRGLKYRPVGGNSERGQLYWRCSKSGCKGRLHTSLGYDQPKMVSSHSCPYGLRQSGWEGVSSSSSPPRRPSASKGPPKATLLSAMVLKRNQEMLDVLRSLPVPPNAAMFRGQTWPPYEAMFR